MRRFKPRFLRTMLERMMAEQEHRSGMGERRERVEIFITSYIIYYPRAPDLSVRSALSVQNRGQQLVAKEVRII